MIHSDDNHCSNNHDSPTIHLSHHHGISNNIAIAFFLNLLFCVIELIGGVLTNSIAILSDALHDFGDSFSLGLAWYFQKLSRKRPDSRYTYGYKRFSTLSALINSMVLLTGSGFVLYASISRLFAPAETNAQGMLALAVLGIIVNGAALIRLKRGKSLNEKVVSTHMLEDVLGWVAVLFGSLVMMFVDIPVLDPILSIGISFYILFNVYHNLMSTFRVILQGKPSEVDETVIRESLLNLPKVQSLHDLHIWTMDNQYMVLTVHLVVGQDIIKAEQQALRTAAHKILKDQNIQHSTIEIEDFSESCDWCDDKPEGNF